MSIFVNIASYRDPSLVRTVTEAIQNANDPDGIFFGIGLQYYEDEIPDLSFVKKENIKTLYWHPDARPGLVKIRSAITRNLYNNEDYFFMIDSHMAFEQGWDTALINQLAVARNAGIAKPFLSYVEQTKDNIGRFEVFHPTIINGDGYWFSKVVQVCKDFEDNDFFVTNTVICSMIFAPRQFVEEVKFDNISNMTLEQPYIALYAFMKGWDSLTFKQNYVRVNHEEYIRTTWGGSLSNRVYESAVFKDDPVIVEEMIKFMLMNLGIFAIREGRRRSPAEFWNAMIKHLPDQKMEISYSEKS